MYSKRYWLILALIAPVALAGLGCEELGLSGGDDDDRDRSDDDVVVSRDTDRRELDEIPTGADRIEAVKGREFSYEFKDDGRVYIYDREDDKLVYEGNVRDGERLVIDPQEDKLTVDGDPVGDRDLNLRAAHEYQIYFDRE